MILQTNAGDAKTNLKAQVPNYGEVWFDSNGMANIFSFAKMEDRYRITYDSAVESAFNVHTDDGIVKFRRSAEGLYYHTPTYETGTTLVQTVDENKSFYTDRQFAHAKRARELLHTLGCPSISDLKRVIKMNSIQECPVTIEDIERAAQIFGPDVPSLKGKTARSRPTPIVTDVVDIPRELLTSHQNVELCVDTMFVNTLSFVTTISKTIKYRTCDYIPTRTVGEYIKVLTKVVQQYNDAGLAVRCFYSDQEYALVFKHFKESSPPIDFNLANAQEHVPEAERNNRTLQERMRATFHSLPYQALPSVFIKHLASETAEKLNFFPAKGGVSAYYSRWTYTYIAYEAKVEGQKEGDPRDLVTRYRSKRSTTKTTITIDIYDYDRYHD